MIDRPYTRHQVPRGARPDAVRNNRLYLIKKVQRLRLTYQIRVLTALAAERGTHLIVVVPGSTTISGDLRAFVKEHRPALRIERR